ncbi:MAG: UDP-N-acetylmuramoyl-L-alanyl-D-glutamate--2,6-diaminopimelate ligase [Acholeplasmatales bacterium]|jgi:UDP-N-acetylmuramoyl-L-alanyl-D-glutamate--2,6-diaminopimelate ligase|nr:UDP-N-acetylmuramoyl-L-alanyl-D-glutamate--2,6-diaminopimelate ligase [Acholeplasmatales bacterium]
MLLVIAMKVNTLLRKARLPQGRINHDVYKLTLDSRLCIENSVFVAIDGNHKNAELFIEDAIAHGAKTIITAHSKLEHKGINYIYVTNVRKCLAKLAKIYYRNVSKKLNIIGVIGTNGKTTTSSIGYHFFNSINKTSMLIGSNGVFYPGYEARIDNTTPDILTIYQYLSLARKKHIHTIFMEISSISIDQYRVYGIHFHTLIFTNFTQDHLDYHKTLENYLYCKTIPFIKLPSYTYAIMNSDDEAFADIEKFCDARLISYGYQSPAMVLGTLNTLSEQGISFYAKNILFKTKLIGEFNIYNMLAIVALCDVFHISAERFKDFLRDFEPISGRMNHICIHDKHILIDYAHTFFATKSVIEEAMKLCKGNLFIVMGCGGNREKEKRFMIGSYLNEVNARIILTQDNPRFEDPKDIIRDMTANLVNKYEIILDRKQAILTALKDMKEKDYLLLLGKGCENYMDIRGVKYPYSDLEVIHDWIRTN